MAVSSAATCCTFVDPIADVADARGGWFVDRLLRCHLSIDAVWWENTEGHVVCTIPVAGGEGWMFLSLCFGFLDYCPFSLFFKSRLFSCWGTTPVEMWKEPVVKPLI